MVENEVLEIKIWMSPPAVHNCVSAQLWEASPRGARKLCQVIGVSFVLSEEYEMHWIGV